MHLRRTFLHNAQARIDQGHLRLEEILGIKVQGGGNSGQFGLIDALQELLRSSGKITKVCVHCSCA